MGRGAPNKKGLVFFPKMVDFYEDDRIFDLLDRYGPLGVTVYDCILCIVYKHGYYAEIPLDKLSRMIVKMIGNKWVKNKKAVEQVVHFCSEIGLIDDDLMTKNIITSVGIQKRFHKIAVKLMKRQLYDEKYWLLGNEENEEPLLNAPINRLSSEEKRISSEENPHSSEISTLKEKENKEYIYTAAPDKPFENAPINRLSSEEKRISSEENPHSSEISTLKEKENKEYIYTAAPDKPFENPDLEKAFQLFVVCRSRSGDDLSPERLTALRSELQNLGADDRERIAIVNKAVANSWKSFYPIRKREKQTAIGKVEKKNRLAVANSWKSFYPIRKREKQTAIGKVEKKNRFNNFKQREYDYNSLEAQLLAQRGETHEKNIGNV